MNVWFRRAKPPMLVRRFDTMDVVDLVGGKGQSLQQLCSIGAPVPVGLILTTDFCAALLTRPHSLSALCQQALDTVQATFAGDRLIVRSSAVGEDSHAAAFAGLLESIFPVDARDRKALEEAIRQCVLSQKAPRVKAYEEARGIRLGGMAVVVQRLVESVAAGVLFTDGVRLHGEWCVGQGQTLVDGAVTPGAFLLERAEGRPVCIERLPEDGSAFPLDARACATLVRHAVALERRRGVALDIEWALDASGSVWFVQARPLTHERTYLYSNANISENFPTPVVPLLASFACAGYDAYFRNLAREFGIANERIRACDGAFRGIVTVHGARLYYNLSHIHSVLRLMPFGDMLVDSFDTFVGSGASLPHGFQWADEMQQFASVLGHVLRAYRDLPARIERFERTIDDVAKRWHPRGLAAMSLDELGDGLRTILDIRLRRWVDASLADCAAALTYRALQGLLQHQHAEDPGRHHVLLEGLDVAGAWSLRALWDLARVVATSECACDALAQCTEATNEGFDVFCAALEPDLRHRVQEWLDRYGFRGSGELLLTEPSLAEEPGRLLPLLQRYVQAAREADDASPGAAFERQKKVREQMTARFRAAFALPLRPIFDLLVSATHVSVQCRERARFRQALLYSRLRSVALACGKRFVATNALDREEDVFFLTFEELVGLSRTNPCSPLEDLRPLVCTRREKFAELSTLEVPDVFTLGAGHQISANDFGVGLSTSNELLDEGALVGVPASRGRVDGRAAVLEGLADAHRLRRGDVLVARQTDPGWAPLFFLVRGLVLERGGMLSHGSILARELGIPSVVGVPRATARIAHGSNIVVDGDAGRVECH